jgi:tetratricopeptide (TPR) repeat protein
VSILENLERLRAGGRDDALLHFSLAGEYLKAERLDEAAAAAARATELDPEYSAAWKIHGKALAAAGRAGEAVSVFEQGIETAERHGDIQAAKEMRVFLKRLRKDAP